MGPRFSTRPLRERKHAPTERELFKAELLYKTRMCREWQRFGRCPRGKDCQFAHGEAELRRLPGRGEVGEDRIETVCLCNKEFSGCRFWPEFKTGCHQVRVGDTSGQEGNETTTLLGSLSQLCAAFYHGNSWEAGVKVCLHWPADETGLAAMPFRQLSFDARDATRKCSKSQVVVVARLRVKRGDDEAQEIYVARYANCFRGNTDVNVHAEEFMLEDEQLAIHLAALTEEDHAELRMYMTYQPCHHSGGRVPKDERAREGYLSEMPVHETSCSERLLAYYAETLKPKGVALSLVLADIYKATWEEELHPSEAERRVYGNKSAAAREGMCMLMNAGVTMRGMRRRDWDFLVSLCNEDVQKAWATKGEPVSPISKMHVALRERMDAYVSYFLSGGEPEGDKDEGGAEGGGAEGGGEAAKEGGSDEGEEGDDVTKHHFDLSGIKQRVAEKREIAEER
jgi:hypothetical protein